MKTIDQIKTEIAKVRAEWRAYQQAGGGKRNESFDAEIDRLHDELYDAEDAAK